MPDPDAALKQMVTEFLGTNGLAVEEIPAGPGKTPDLWIQRGQPDSLLLELKTKEDDPTEVQELGNQLKSGHVVERSKPIDRWDGLRKITGYAVKQMQAHDPAHTSHHVLWFHCTGIDATVAEVRMEATLYGTQKLVSTQVKNVITAYYYHPGAFYRFRDTLDAVVVSRGAKAGLRLNPFSTRVAALRSTKFAVLFGTPDLPKADRPDVMICGADAPRGDESAMLGYLRGAYQLTHLQTMPMGFLSGWVESPGS